MATVPRTRSKPLILAASFSLGIAVLLAAHVAYRLHTAKALFPTSAYVVDALGLFALGVSLGLTAFHLAGKGASMAPNVLVSAAALLVVTSGFDAYVLAFRDDTVGPASTLWLTHRQWFERFVVFNKDRYWERDFTPYCSADRGRKRIIAAVGDSFTWGQGLPGRRFRFTDQLQAKLQASLGGDIEVLNFAIVGGSTTLETETINGAVRRVRPSVVAVFYLSNDIDELPVLRRQDPTFSPLSSALLRSSPTVNFLCMKLLMPMLYRRSGEAYFYNLLAAYLREERLARHVGDIKQQLAAVRAIGAAPVFVIMPFPHMWQPVEREWRDRIYGRIARDVGHTGTPVVELQSIEAEMSPAEFQVNSTDGHPNRRVHALIAERLHRWFVQNPGILGEPRP